MKKPISNFRFTIFFLLVSIFSHGQHTFSIVAVDTATGEIGSAAATCINSEDGARDVSAIVLGIGAINTQSFWDPTNQANATNRMVAGDSPEEIITWLQNNDVAGSSSVPSRQYGIIDLNAGDPRSAAFTGTDNFDEKGHRLGSNYAIQGNILISQDVLDDMETAFVNSAGQPLCDRLMATMQAAKRPGADQRCLVDGISSGSAYIRVAQPTDTDASYGNLWLDINVWLDSGTFTGDPIDELQIQFDIFKDNLSLPSFEDSKFSIIPNPVQEKTLVTLDNSNQVDSIEVYNILGKLILDKKVTGDSNTIKLDLKVFSKGIYIAKFSKEGKVVVTKKLVKN